MRLTFAIWLAAVAIAPAEDFEGFPAGPFERLVTGAGTWVAEKGHATIHEAHARSGKQSLRLLGGEGHAVELQWERPLARESGLSFWAERWTRNKPFSFRIEAKRNGGWSGIYTGDTSIRVGGFLTKVDIVVAEGTEALRFTGTSPPGSGLMIDDLALAPVRPMIVREVTTFQPVIPALIRKKINPVLGLRIVTEGRIEPNEVTGLTVSLAGTTRVADVKSVQVLFAGANGTPGAGEPFGEARGATDELVFTGTAALDSGENFFWVSAEMNAHADLDGRVDAAVLGVRFDGKEAIVPEVTSPDGAQRIGYAVRQHGDDGSRAFRIPGLATTNHGTLIGVYDVRRRGGGDLPGDIDVGMSRSTDGGQSWEPMRVIMNMGDDPKWRYDGVGDPAVLVDRTTNRVWVAATWSHGNRSWNGSGPGITPEETGQFMMVSSDDDGVTWSKPINITEQVKRPEWRFLLQGPGKGITLEDGTLVFAAQYRDGDRSGTPFSSIIHSKDHGKTWHMGTGIKPDTTEAQVVQLGDGSLMLNCRDNRGGARTIGVTTDLGKTWTLHPTDRKALNEPVCMASLIRVAHPSHGNFLVFSNPDTTRGRSNMTIKISKDEGLTWPKERHTLYDSRNCSGYSCLTRVGDDQVGVLYEGPTELYFLRFGMAELLGE